MAAKAEGELDGARCRAEIASSACQKCMYIRGTGAMKGVGVGAGEGRPAEADPAGAAVLYAFQQLQVPA